MQLSFIDQWLTCLLMKLLTAGLEHWVYRESISLAQRFHVLRHHRTRPRASRRSEEFAPWNHVTWKLLRGGSYLFDAYRGRSWQGYAFFGEKLSVRIYSMAVDHFLIEKKKSLRLTWDNVFAFQSLQVLRTCSKNSYPTKYILKSYSMVRTFFNGSIGWKRCLIFVRPIKFCNISNSVSEKGTLSECRKRMYMYIFIRSNRL